MKFFTFFLLIFVFILPFVYIPGSYNPFEFPKFLLTICFVQILIILRVIISLKNPISSPTNKTLLLLGAFLIVLFLADMFGLDPTISFSGGAYRQQGFLFFLSISMLFFMTYTLSSSEKTTLWRSFTKGAFVQFFLVTLYALFHSIQFSLFQNYSIPLFQGRIVTTFGNPHFLAGYVLMLLPIALFGLQLFSNISQKIKIIIQILLLILTIITVYATDSKSTMIAALCMGFFWIYCKKRTVTNTVIKNHFVPFLFAIVLVGTALVLTTVRHSVWDNRTLIWENAIQAILQKPFLGIGQENFQLIVSQSHFTVDNAHNIFLEIAVAAGVPALLIFCSFLYFTIKRVSFVLKLGSLAFLICASFNPVSIPQIVLFFFILSFSDQKKYPTTLKK